MIEPLTIWHRYDGDRRIVFIDRDWPHTTAFSSELLRIVDNGGVFDVDANRLTIWVDNGCAVYALGSEDECGNRPGALLTGHYAPRVSVGEWRH